MPSLNIIKLYDYGSNVREVQLLINSIYKPDPRLKPDGHFGRQTYLAVVAFQKSRGLVADGEVGSRTRAALGIKPTPNASIPPIIKSSTRSWLDIAIAELGVHEEALPGQHHPRILEYHQTTTLKATTDETPWCSSFVNWVLTQASYRGTNNALAKSWLSWGMEESIPQLGSIVVIKKKTPGVTQDTGSTTGFHVGFYVSSTEAHIRILGGNQSNRVKYSNFFLSSFDVKGYRRPV